MHTALRRDIFGELYGRRGVCGLGFQMSDLWYFGAEGDRAYTRYLSALQRQLGVTETGKWDCETRSALVEYVNAARSQHGSPPLGDAKAAWLSTEILEDYGADNESGEAVISMWPVFLAGIGLPTDRAGAAEFRAAMEGTTAGAAVREAVALVASRVEADDGRLICGGGSGGYTTGQVVGVGVAGLLAGLLIGWALS